MRIATWSVDGINSRLKYLCHWLASRKPDVVALQKTFVATDQFPRGTLREAGYESIHFSQDGEFRNGWGVAVLSTTTLPKPEILQMGLPSQEDRDARFLTVGVGELEISSVYAPYGDPRRHGVDGAIRRKLRWMQLLREHVDQPSVRSRKCVLAGDFNVVSDGRALRKTLNYTEEERRELSSLLETGFVDLYRRLHSDPRTGHNYDFNVRRPVSSRLHRILGTEPIANLLRKGWVDLEYRNEIDALKNCRCAQSAPLVVDLSDEASPGPHAIQSA